MDCASSSTGVAGGAPPSPEDATGGVADATAGDRGGGGPQRHLEFTTQPVALERCEIAVRSRNEIGDQYRQNLPGAVGDAVIPQANLIGLPHVHRQAARIGAGVGIPRLHAENVRDAQSVHLVRAPIGTHRRMNVVNVLLVDLEPSGDLNERFHRVLVEIRQTLLGPHDPRHAVNAVIDINRWLASF